MCAGRVSSRAARAGELGDGSRDGPGRIRFVRSVHGMKRRRVAGVGGIERVWIIAGAREERESSRIAWSTLNDWEKQRTALLGDSSERKLASAAEFDPQVLHIIGTPLPTSSGVRLQLSEFGSRAKVAKEGRGNILRPDILTDRLLNLVLCVVQAAPGEVHPRSGTDREQAAYLRHFPPSCSWAACRLFWSSRGSLRLLLPTRSECFAGLSPTRRADPTPALLQAISNVKEGIERLAARRHRAKGGGG